MKTTKERAIIAWRASSWNPLMVDTVEFQRSTSGYDWFAVYRCGTRLDNAIQVDKTSDFAEVVYTPKSRRLNVRKTNRA